MGGGGLPVFRGKSARGGVGTSEQKGGDMAKAIFAKDNEMPGKGECSPTDGDRGWKK